MNPIYTPDRFSPHLFWDIDRSELDMEKHAAYIVQRVLEYGLLIDWKIIQRYYGIRRIGEIAATLRCLEPKALAFISAKSKIPKEQFRCYILKQSGQQPWEY